MTNENITNTKPTNSGINLQEVKPTNSGINLKETLNIPDYDPIKYPMPNEESAVRAYGLMYKMNLLGAGADKNITSMLLKFYCDVNDYLMNNDQTLINVYTKNLIETLNKMKDYCKKTDNPLLK